MIITGVFVNGPYAMITTAVSADLVSLLLTINVTPVCLCVVCVCVRVCVCVDVAITVYAAK